MFLLNPDALIKLHIYDCSKKLAKDLVALLSKKIPVVS